MKLWSALWMEGGGVTINSIIIYCLNPPKAMLWQGNGSMDRSAVTSRMRPDWKEPVVRGASPVVMLHLYKYSHVRVGLPQTWRGWGGRVRCMGPNRACGRYKQESRPSVLMIPVTMVTIDGSWMSVWPLQLASDMGCGPSSLLGPPILFPSVVLAYQCRVCQRFTATTSLLPCNNSVHWKSNNICCCSPTKDAFTGSERQGLPQSYQAVRKKELDSRPEFLTSLLSYT